MFASKVSTLSLGPGETGLIENGEPIMVYGVISIADGLGFGSSTSIIYMETADGNDTILSRLSGFAVYESRGMGAPELMPFIADKGLQFRLDAASGQTGLGEDVLAKITVFHDHPGT